MSPLRASRARCAPQLPPFLSYSTHVPSTHHTAEPSMTSSVSSPSAANYADYRQMRDPHVDNYPYDTNQHSQTGPPYYREDYIRPGAMTPSESYSRTRPPLPAMSHVQVAQGPNHLAPVSDSEYYNPGFIRILPRTVSLSNRYRKDCETCGAEHDGTFGAGRFCSSRCARTVGGLAHRKKRLAERGMIADAAAVQLPPGSYTNPTYDFHHIPTRPLNGSIMKRQPSYHSERALSESLQSRYGYASRQATSTTSSSGTYGSSFHMPPPSVQPSITSLRLTAEPSKLEPLSLPRPDMSLAQAAAKNATLSAPENYSSSISKEPEAQPIPSEPITVSQRGSLPSSPLSPPVETPVGDQSKTCSVEMPRTMSLSALLNPSR